MYLASSIITKLDINVVDYLTVKSGIFGYTVESSGLFEITFKGQSSQ